MMRRLLVIVVAGLILVVLLVPFLIVAVLIKLSSRGSVFYRQERIGRDGHPFRLLKFRTMALSEFGPMVTPEGDPRITPVGRFLRRWKIDELPQLLNVLRGEMSLIGPRPEVERFVRHYTPAQRAILRQTPGLAGMAQLVYPHEADLLRNHPDPEAAYVEQLLPKKLAVDLEYERRRSFASDLRLIGELALLVLGCRRYIDRDFRLKTHDAGRCG